MNRNSPRSNHSEPLAQRRRCPYNTKAVETSSTSDRQRSVEPGERHRTLNATRSDDELVMYSTVGGCFLESAAHNTARHIPCQTDEQANAAHLTQALRPGLLMRIYVALSVGGPLSIAVDSRERVIMMSLLEPSCGPALTCVQLCALSKHAGQAH